MKTMFSREVRGISVTVQRSARRLRPVSHEDAAERPAGLFVTCRLRDVAELHAAFLLLVKLELPDMIEDVVVKVDRRH